MLLHRLEAGHKKLKWSVTPPLLVEVRVLSPLRPIASPAQIRLGADGVLLEKGLRSAVFLPEVAVEQGWNLSTLPDELAQKGQMPKGAWREGASLLAAGPVTAIRPDDLWGYLQE